MPNVSPPFPKTEKIWMDGRFIPWDEAKVHVLSHAIHYGSSVFEGMRCYDTRRGPAIFRLDDHLKRLLWSARIYRMDDALDLPALRGVCKEIVRVNGLRECYLRPILFRGFGQMGMNALACPVHVVVAAWSWANFFDPTARERGIDACVSSWVRPAPNTLPLLAKAGANYMNSQLIKLEALRNGYHEGIAVDIHGYVSEASAENLFIVREDGVITPPSNASILPGLTRHTVLTLAREAGYKVSRQMIPREGLYVADEVFLTGTAAEVLPVRSVDRIPIGDGRPGPVTRVLMERFAALVSGEAEDKRRWLDPVE